MIFTDSFSTADKDLSVQKKTIQIVSTITNKNAVKKEDIYTLIDQGKTIALSFSGIAGGKDSTGTWYYVPITGYCEFYFNGQSNG